MLESPESLQALWGELVVDFSHELITGAWLPSCILLPLLQCDRNQICSASHAAAADPSQ